MLRRTKSWGWVFGTGVVILAFSWSVTALGVGLDAATNPILIAVYVGMAFTGAFLLSTEGYERGYESTLGRAVGLLLYLAYIQAVITAGGLNDDFVLFFALILLVLGLGATGFWRRWRFWKPPPDEGVARNIAFAAVALLMLTQSIATVTGVLYHNGVVETKAVVTEPSLWTFEKYYIWHFLEGIPLLKVPATLNFTQPFDVTDPLGGGLLLGYKLMVILPIITVASQYFKAEAAEDDAAPVAVAEAGSTTS